MFTSDQPLGPKPQRRWSFVSWWFSLILIVPLLGLIFTVAYTQLGSDPDIEGVVLDAYSGEPVADVAVELGDHQTTTDEQGRFGLPQSDANMISVSKDGYDPTNFDISTEETDVEISIRPNTLTGTVLHRVTDEPLAGVTVQAMIDSEIVASTETDDEGNYTLTDVPDGAEIVFEYPDFASVSERIGQQLELSTSLRPAVVSGTVTDENGDPIRAAIVAIGEAHTETAEDGTYRLEDAPESGELIFKAPGYSVASVELDDELSMDVSLEEKPVRAIYVTASSAADEARFDELLDLVDRTELNAMVIDIKDSSGFVFYDTNVQLAHDIDAVRPAYDVHQILDKVKERGIYAIARQVVFEDPILAEARPDVAIRDSADGGLWRTWNGLAWVSAYQEDVWNYNIELMLEAVELGFDEIQLDYIRFPSDGPLNRADYGVPEHNTESRNAAVSEFLKRSHEALMPTRAYLAGDIFGLTLWELGDGGIGQNLETVIDHLDYINPMIYPSHFYPGSMGFDEPNDHPYEVILWSLENGLERVPDHHRKIRPWLQDFSYGPGIEYGTAEVRAQIQACEEFDASGWMLWSASNRYHEDALAEN